MTVFYINNLVHLAFGLIGLTSLEMAFRASLEEQSVLRDALEDESLVRSVLDEIVTNAVAISSHMQC